MKKKAEASSEAQPANPSTTSEPVNDFKDPYTFEFLLNRIFNNLTNNNPSLVASKGLKVKRPKINRVSKTRIAWTNFNDLCQSIKRNPEHVQNFVNTELGTDGTLDREKGHLTLRGKFNEKQIENIISKYLKEYVQCQLCRSYESDLKKNSGTRSYELHCLTCKSSRTVTVIKKDGYHHTTTADRKNEKK